MAGLDDVAIAARFREAIHREAIKAVRRESPPYRYGTVTQIDPDIRRVKVQFSGEPSAVNVKLIGLQPSAVGQVVQVSGRTGDLFVSGIVGQSQVVGTPQDGLLPPTNFQLVGGLGSILASWTEATGAVKYELQVAEDIGMTVVIRNLIVYGNGQLVTELNTPVSYHARVRSINNDDGVSGWSDVQSATTQEFPSGDANSDGQPPSDSPDAIVTGGMGYLAVDWLEIANADAVIYDVHLSVVSGFTPDENNKVGSTPGTFYFINKNDAFTATVLATESGDPIVTESGDFIALSGIAVLDYDTTYFVRIVARDADGSAIPGAQGSGQMVRLDSDDVGLIPRDAISDGVPPSSSPDIPSITNGVGYLLVNWQHITNPDGANYEVHISNTSGFTPNANTFVGDTPSNWFFVRKVGPGLGGGALQYGVTYYIKIWATDPDGYAPAPSPQGTGFIARVVGVDIGTNTITAENIMAGTITAASGVIADLAIGTAKIQTAAITTAKIANASIITAKIADLQVTNAKIADLSVSSAKIGNLAVTNAKIADASITSAKIDNAAITTAKIQDAAITNAKISDLQWDKGTGGTLTLGGINNQQGVLNVLSANGEDTLSSIDGDVAVFGPLMAGSISVGSMDTGYLDLGGEGVLTGYQSNIPTYIDFIPVDRGTDAYPDGWSIMYVSFREDWPSQYGQVWTYVGRRGDGNRIWQWFYRKSNPGYYIRSANNDDTAWNGWYFFEPTLVSPTPEPPPQTTTRTLTYAATDIDSYRPNYGWRNQSRVYQGSWGYGDHIGCIAFNTASIANSFSSISKIQLRLRRGTGHGYAAARRPTFWSLSGAATNTSSRLTKSGKPDLINGTNWYSSVAWARGDDKWVTLPSSFHARFVAGSLGGIATALSESLSTTGGLDNEYMFFDQITPTLKITGVG